MVWLFVIGIILIIAFLFPYGYSLWAYVFPPVEYYKSSIDNLDYQIISTFHEKTHAKAANKLAAINKFIIDFIRHMKKKYIVYPKNVEIDDPGEFDWKLNIARNLLYRYNPDVLRENNPDTTKDTSYVLNKGREIAFCLRAKHIDEDIFHDFELVKFVILHELAHLGSNLYGHGDDFWRSFKFLTWEAYSAGMYKPVDYSIHPAKYCGVNIFYNPFFDGSL